MPKKAVAEETLESKLTGMIKRAKKAGKDEEYITDGESFKRLAEEFGQSDQTVTNYFNILWESVGK